MTQTISDNSSAVEYRFTWEHAQRECPLCKAAFTTTPGPWPFLASSGEPVCAGPACPVGDEVSGEADNRNARQCDARFAFTPLDPRTVEAISATDAGLPVAERLRLAALGDAVPVPDRDLLCRASIDLAFCEADATRIEALEPALVLRTCGEAAAEMLLSGCGEIL